MSLIFSTIEIALLIMLPLILFYKKSAWKTKSVIIWLPVLYMIWYLSYGIFHEFLHLVGIWISGKEIFNYHLFPQIWKGEFGTLYVNYDFQGDINDFFIILLPYLRDLILVIIGFYIIKRKIVNHPFSLGLVLIILVFSSLYDVSNNYIIYLTGYKNDFNALKVSSNEFISHFIGISFILISLILTVKVIDSGKDYPVNDQQ